MRKALALTAVTLAATCLSGPPALAVCDERPDVCEGGNDAFDRVDEVNERTRDITDSPVHIPPVVPRCSATGAHSTRKDFAALRGAEIWFDVTMTADCFPADQVICLLTVLGTVGGLAVEDDGDGNCVATATTTSAFGEALAIIKGSALSDTATPAIWTRTVSVTCVHLNLCRETYR